MTIPHATQLRRIGELANQHRDTHELVDAILKEFPKMTIDEIETALGRAGEIYLREAKRLKAQKASRLVRQSEQSG